jgi:hypothetical protein
MQKITEYKTIVSLVSLDTIELDRMVNFYIKEGWQPFERQHQQTDHRGYTWTHQVLVKYEESK